MDKYLNRQFRYYKDGRTYTVTAVRRNKIVTKAEDGTILAAKPKIFTSWVNQGKVKWL